MIVTFIELNVQIKYAKFEDNISIKPRENVKDFLPKNFKNFLTEWKRIDGSRSDV